MVDAIGEQTTTIADTLHISAVARKLLGLQQDQLRAQRFEGLLQLEQTVRCARQVAAAALLHDLGLTEKYASQARFEVDGANAARSFLQARGVSPQHVQVVWDAIALHAHGTIALYKEPEVSVIFEAVAVDAVGYAFDRIPPNQMKAILNEFPRLGMKRGITACFTKVAREKPETTYDNSLRDFGSRFVEGYHVAVTGPDLIANAPFED